MLHDIENNKEALDLRAAAARRECPWLILHGAADETVPLAEGQALADAGSSPYELQVIPNGSHTFGAKHPFQGPTPELVQAMNGTQEWLSRHLRRR